MSIVNDYIDGYSGYVTDSTNKLPYNRLANLEKGSETWRDFLKFMFTEEGSYNLDHNGIRETDFPNGWESVAGFINDKVDLDSLNPYRVAFHSLDFNDGVDVKKADFLTRYLEEREKSGDLHWNESLAFWIDFYKDHFDLDNLINGESEVEYNEDGTVKDSHGAIGNGSPEGKYNFRIHDVLFGDAGNSFELNEEWVKSWFNIDGDTYKLVREGNADGSASVYDNILLVLTDYRELQFTRFPDTEAMAKAFYRTDKEEREETFQLMLDYLRLIMPKYLRRVEIEDLDRNFWVIAQVISALSAYLFDDNNLQKYLQGLMDEIVLLWENIPYLWAEFGMLNTSTKYEDIQAMMIPVLASAIMRGPIFDNIGRESTIGTVNIGKDYDYDAAYLMLVNSWEKLSYLKDLYGESNLLIVPEIRDYNYHKNYYARAYYPGIIEYDRNTDKMRYIVFDKDDTEERNYNKYLDTEKSIYYIPDVYSYRIKGESDESFLSNYDFSVITWLASQAAVLAIPSLECTIEYSEEGNETRVPIDYDSLLSFGGKNITIYDYDNNTEIETLTFFKLYKIEEESDEEKVITLRNLLVEIFNKISKSILPYIGRNSLLYSERYIDCHEDESDFTYIKKSCDFPLYLKITGSNYDTLEYWQYVFLSDLLGAITVTGTGKNLKYYFDYARELAGEGSVWYKKTDDELKSFISNTIKWLPRDFVANENIYYEDLYMYDSEGSDPNLYYIPNFKYLEILTLYIGQFDSNKNYSLEQQLNFWNRAVLEKGCEMPEGEETILHYLSAPDFDYAILALHFMTEFKDKDKGAEATFVIEDEFKDISEALCADNVKQNKIYKINEIYSTTHTYSYIDSGGTRQTKEIKTEVNYLVCTKPRYVLIDDVEHPGDRINDIYLVSQGNNIYKKYFYNGVKFLTNEETVEIKDTSSTSDEMTPDWQYLVASDGADWYSFVELSGYFPNGEFPYRVNVDLAEIVAEDFRKVPLNIDLTKKTDKFDIYNYCTAMYEDDENYYFCPSFSAMDSETYYNTTEKIEKIDKVANHQIYVDTKTGKEYSGYYYSLIRTKFHNSGDKLSYREDGIWWSHDGEEKTTHTLLISFQDAIKEFFGDKIGLKIKGGTCDSSPENLEKWYIQHEYDTTVSSKYYDVININFERCVDYYRQTQTVFDDVSTKFLDPIKKTEAGKGYDRGELLSYLRFIERDKIRYKTESEIYSYGPLNMLGSGNTSARNKYSSSDETGMNALISDLNKYTYPADSSNYAWKYYHNYVHTTSTGNPIYNEKGELTEDEGVAIKRLRTRIKKDKEFYAKIILLKAVVPYDNNDYNMSIGRGKFECLPFAVFIWSTGQFATGSSTEDEINIYSKILPIKAYGHPQCMSKTYSSIFPYPYISSEHDNKWANATQMLGLTPSEDILIDIDDDKKITRKINTNSSFKVNKPCYCSKEWTENCSTFGNLQGSEVSFSVEAYDRLIANIIVSLDRDFVIYAADSSYCLSSKADGTLKYKDMVPYYYDCSIIQEDGVYKVKAVYYSQVEDTKGGYYIPADNYGYNIDSFKYTDDFKEYVKELV